MGKWINGRYVIDTPNPFDPGVSQHLRREKMTKSPVTGIFSFRDLEIACRNIGFDINCGACAELFYTGYRNDNHDESCQTVRVKS